MQQSFVDFINEGNWSGNIIMILLFLLSIVAVYIFIERLIILRYSKKQIDSFLVKIKQSLENEQYDESIDLIEAHNSIAASVLKKAIKTLGGSKEGVSEVNLVIDTIGNNKIISLERGFSTLASIAGGAPMIGFLGTVIGMVQAFYQMSTDKGTFEVSSLSQGIYTAMFTTVGGLVVGIIAYFAYNTLVSKLKKLSNSLESVKIKYIELRKHK